MYNPYEVILSEIQGIKSDIATLSNKIPANVPVRKYSPKELAEATPMSEQTIVSAIKKGLIKAQKFGRKYLIPQDEFERACKEVKSIKYQRPS